MKSLKTLLLIVFLKTVSQTTAHNEENVIQMSFDRNDENNIKYIQRPWLPYKTYPNIRKLKNDLNSNLDTNFIEISLSGNGWITKKDSKATEVITKNGLAAWTSNNTIISAYFHSNISMIFDLYIRCKVSAGKSEISVTIESDSRKIHVESKEYGLVNAGQFKIKSPGYVKVDLHGVTKTGTYFADVSHLVIDPKTTEKSIQDIPENTDQTYWGRRGPSVHMWYNLPQDHNQEYYYNEVNIPKGYDPSGSYFMTIGFDHGYFGIQVNSETERRVLFSVWSPQKTDDHKNVTEENKVKLLSKGKNVLTEDFGGEGSGMHAYLNSMWKTETTYRFLVKSKPSVNSTIYTAWYAIGDNDWQLVSSFKYPKVGYYLSGFYSFVENFNPDSGYLIRKSRFNNQWVCNDKGVWVAATGAQFTGDDIATRKVRLDFDGGVNMNGSTTQGFYLRNGGFIDGKSKLNTHFPIEYKIKPKVSFEKLPQN